MVISKVTATEYSTMIASGVNLRDKTLDTNIAAHRDIFIDPVAEVFEAQNDRIVYLSNLTSLRNVEKVVPDDLDSIAFNEAMVRWDGSSSLATVTFSRVQIPTFDITVPANFPIATLVDPATGVSVTFRTVETRTLFFASPDAYYNAETQKYELNVLVASVSSGTETEVGAYTITNPLRALSGFDEVANKAATTSGRGTETNVELSKRYLLQVEGNNLGTPAGAKKWVLDNFSSAEDVYVVYGEDENLTRDQTDAGAVDMWILGESPVELTYTTTYPGVEQLIATTRQPLISVSQVSTSGGIIFVEGTDYEVVTGEGEYSYSARGSDGIKFLAGGSAPAALQDPVYIVYSYNSLITTLDSFFTQPEFYSMGMDKLFRWAQAQQITIEANLKVSAGNPDTVKANVRTAILTYINGLKLGENVEEFDIDREVGKIIGVDNFVYVTLAYLGGTGVNDLPITPNMYARLNEADIVVNLV